MEDKYFEELKVACKKIRGKYKNNPGNYYEEKINRIDSITNPEEAYILINMFDLFNQKELWLILSNELRDYYYGYFVQMLLLQEMI